MGSAALQLGSSFMAVSHAIPFPAPAFPLLLRPLLSPGSQSGLTCWASVTPPSALQVAEREPLPPTPTTSSINARFSPNLTWTCALSQGSEVCPRVGAMTLALQRKVFWTLSGGVTFEAKGGPLPVLSFRPHLCFSGHTRKMKIRFAPYCS